MEPQWFDTPDQMYQAVLKIYNDPETKYHNGFTGGTYADGTVQWTLHATDGENKVFRSRHAA